MAVLNKIRQRSVFLIIIIALALFSFVLADVIRNGGMVSQKSRNTIASINGEDIQREEFAMQVEAYQNNTGNSSTMQAVNVVWDINVRQALLEEQFEELGIKAGEAQIKKMLSVQLAGNPNFSNEIGMFDENKLQEYVATLKATSPAAYQQWVSFEKSVAESARENIYFNMVRAGLLATVPEGEQLYKFENSSVDLEFVEIPYATVPDSQVEVTKAEIKAYMEEHPEQFQSEATRDIRYVLFSEEASAEDQQQVKTELTGLLESKVEYNAVTGANDTIAGFNRTEDIETFVNTNSDVKYVDRFLFKDDLPAEISDDLFSLEEGETFGPYNFNGSWRISKAVAVRQMPDSAKARHILIAFEGSPTAMGTTRTKEEAAALADSLVQVVRQDETKFAELASEFSTDMSNKQSGGELGWFAPGVFVPAFNDFIFSNEEGEVGVVESEFGYHVVHIQEMTEPQRAVKLATIVREIQPSEKTLNDLYAEVTKFEMNAEDGEFATVAEEIGKDVRPVKDIQALEENIPGIGVERGIVQWAFGEEANVGDIERFDTDEGYVVVQLTAENPKGLKSVEAASATVLPILQKEKKAEIIEEKISASTLEAIASEMNVAVEKATAVNRNSPVLPGSGSEPIVVGRAFGMEEGEVSEPIAGNNGVFVVELLNKEQAQELDSYMTFRNRQTAQRRSSIGTDVVEALKENAEIEDNRARFY